MSAAFEVALFGATGYGGQELLRLLAAHPRLRVTAAVSERARGRKVEEVHPQLEGVYDCLRFRGADDPLPAGCAAAFLAVPHGTAIALVERLPAEIKIVDLSNDFRLRSAERFRAVYGAEVRFPEQAPGFSYGLPETNRDAIRSATRVASPGCFATGALIALAPLAGLLEGDVTLAQTTGSSGSGAGLKPTTHHPERAQDMRAYKVLTHQHSQEIEQELERLGAGAFDLAMVPQSGPFARGIFTVAHAGLGRDVDVEGLFAHAYGDEFFVRLRAGSPALRHVVRTNFCDLSVHRRGRRVVVLTAIDNLGKGMAGQAIQNLNLMLGLEETAGLTAPGANP
jgi:N-acetyl-gamma-glutamyl-phosphate reductase